MSELQEIAFKSRAFIGRCVWFMSADKPAHRRCHEIVIRRHEILVGIELRLDWETNLSGETTEIVHVPLESVALTKEELMKKVFEL